MGSPTNICPKHQIPKLRNTDWSWSCDRCRKVQYWIDYCGMTETEAEQHVDLEDAEGHNAAQRIRLN